MNSIFRFHDETTTRECLRNSELLNDPYSQEKGVVEPVAALAAKRFSGKELYGSGVRYGAWLTIKDLQSGVDGFNGKKIDKIDVEESFSLMLSEALKKCAKKSS